MFNVAKLSTGTRDQINSIPRLSKGNREVVSFGLAKAISNMLPLPSSQVEFASDFFNDNHAFKLTDIINFINEIMVVDIERAIEVTKNLWLIRYNILYSKRKLFKLTEMPASLTFFGVSNKVSLNDFNFIAANEQSIIEVHNVFYQVIAELDADDSQENNDNERVIDLVRG